MTPFRTPVWTGALLVLAAGGEPVRAAWNNVFQVCCHNCRSSVSNAPPIVPTPCPQPCPQQNCTTRYVLRSYYQPVTTYKPVTWTEPVTTYRTSYFYEPVTSYRYSCYFDPCTCSYQQVAQPVTSYRLRSQCCPVTSYLQRCAMQPVTVQQLCHYYEPQTTCCQTTIGAPIFTQPPGSTLPPSTLPPGDAPPGVGERREPPLSPPPGVREEREAGQTGNDSHKFDRNPPIMPRAPDGTSFRPPQLQGPVPAYPSAPPSAPTQAPPKVRLERIVAIPGHNVEGQVVSADRPRAGARILFVSADPQRTQQTATADGAGEFRTTLASGNWLVYVEDAEGKAVFHQKIEVKDNQSHQFKLVSR
jgi:hypothetical protein